MQELYNVLEESNHELNHRKGDYDGYDRHDQGKEARHKINDAVDNRTEGCIEIESHCLYPLAENTAIVTIIVTAYLKILYFYDVRENMFLKISYTL